MMEMISCLLIHNNESVYEETTTLSNYSNLSRFVQSLTYILNYGEAYTDFQSVVNCQLESLCTNDINRIKLFICKPLVMIDEIISAKPSTAHAALMLVTRRITSKQFCQNSNVNSSSKRQVPESLLHSGTLPFSELCVQEYGK